MGVSYNRLWKMLIDKNMKRIEMQYLTGISGNILARMGKNQYVSCLLYASYEAPANEQNFATLVEMLNAMEVREDDESFKNGATLIAV